MDVLKVISFIKLFLFLIYLQISSATVFAQHDSAATDMSFDFGFTRGRNINAWPILKINRSKEKKDIQAIFSIYGLKSDYKLHTKQTHLLPIWFYDSTATKRDYRFFSTYYPSVFRYTNDVSTQTKSFKFAELAPEINLLEFTRSTDGLYVQNNFLFLLWYKNNQKLNKSHLIFFPIYWSFKNNNNTSQIFFPLFTHGTYSNGQTSFLGITPLFWHTKKQNITRNVLFPLWWHKKTGEGENAKIRNYIFPLFFTAREKNFSSQALFPIFFHKNDLSDQITTLLPIFYYKHNKNNSGNRLMLTPLFWHRTKVDGYRNTLFPIWWQQKTIINQDENYSNVIFPIWWVHKYRDINKHIFFPLIWSIQAHAYNSFTLVPLFSIGHSDDNTQNHAVITPFFWNFKSKTGSSNLLFPLLFNSRQGIGADEKKWNVVFPIYWSYKDKTENNKVLFPILWKLKNEKYKSFSVMPLFSIGSSTDSSRNHAVLTPLFWHIKDHNITYNTLFPLWWQRINGTGENEVRNTVFFPIYWAQKNHFSNRKVLFPLFWYIQDKNYKSVTFIPLFSYGNTADTTRQHLVITPLFWHVKDHDKTYNTLFPIWWNQSQGSGNDARFYNVFFPLYWAKGDHEKNSHVLFPLVWSIKDKKYNSFTFFPLYSSGYAPDSSSNHLMITPLFWHVEKNHETYNVLFPIWFSRKQGTGDSTRITNMFFPFYWSYEDKQKDKVTYFPIVWSRNDRFYNSLTIFPFFSRGNAPDSSSSHLMATPLFWHVRKKDETVNVLFPFWWYKKQGVGNNEKIINNIFPLYFSSIEKDKKYNMLFPFIWNFKDKNYHSFSFIPFVSFGDSPDKNREHLIVTPFFWHFKNHDKYADVLFPLIWNFREGIGIDMKTTSTIFPLYWSQKSKDKSIQIVFPLVWKLRDKNYSSFTISPLFSVGQSPDSLRSHLIVTPLFWQIKRNDLSTTTLFPLWWHKKIGIGANEATSDIVFPFYWAFRDREQNNKILFPIIYSLKNSRYESFTIFPIISQGHSPDNFRSHSMLTPIFWHFQEFENRLNVAFPIWWSKKEVIGDNTRYTNVIFPFYWSFKSNEVDNKILFPAIWSLKNRNYTSFTLFPIFSLGFSPDSIHRHLMFTPLFWHIKNHNKISNTLFPIWWNKSVTIGNDIRISNCIFPVYWSKRTKNSNSHVLFPLIWQYKNELYRSFTLFPIFSYGRSKSDNEGHLMITPLFWNVWKPNSHVATLIPIFCNKSDSMGDSKFSLFYFLYISETKKQKKSVSFLWPLCQFIRDTNYRYFRFAPLVWYENTQEKKYFSILPFYYHIKTDSLARTHFLWQLFVTKNYFDVKKTRSILWKFITWEKYVNNDHSFRIMHLLYANVKKGESTEKSIFPFYYKSTEKNGNKSLSVFLGFYNSFKRQIQDTDEFYQEDRIFWVIRLRSNFKSLKERGLIKDSKQLK